MKISACLALAVLITLVFLPDADAIEARWMGRLGTFKFAGNVKGAGKIKMKAKNFPEGFTLDSSTGLYADLNIGLGLDVRFNLDRRSDRKGTVVTVDDADARRVVNQVFTYLDSRSGGRSLKLGFQVLTINSVSQKGKLSVSKKFDKVSFKVTVKFTGVVAEGRFAGKTVKGKLSLKLKADRI